MFLVSTSSTRSQEMSLPLDLNLLGEKVAESTFSKVITAKMVEKVAKRYSSLETILEGKEFSPIFRHSSIELQSYTRTETHFTCFFFF